GGVAWSSLSGRPSAYWGARRWWWCGSRSPPKPPSRHRPPARPRRWPYTKPLSSPFRPPCGPATRRDPGLESTPGSRPLSRTERNLRNRDSKRSPQPHAKAAFSPSARPWLRIAAQHTSACAGPLDWRLLQCKKVPEQRLGMTHISRGGFTSADAEIAYLEAGQGAPIVLVHGFASTKETNWLAPGWIDTLTRAGRRVIALDDRGHGESTKLYDPERYHSAIMAEDVRALMDHLGL